MGICKIDGCGGQTVAKCLCNKHYLRLRKYGTPHGGTRNHDSLEGRFWRKVAIADGCWEWLGSKIPSGYGHIQEGGQGSKKLSAHRLSYRIHHGDIPPGMVVMHSCDNPSCVNPDHLRVGTYKENTRDMMRKKRHRYVAPLGSQNGKSILTEAEVRYIRERPKMTHAALARELGVSPNCVRGVRIGRTWSHVT
jgi:hypothetical protein